MLAVRTLLLLTLSAVLLALASPAGAAVSTRGSGASALFACTTTWTNTAGGLWSNPANWSAGVPTSGSQACITTAGTYTVELAAATTVNSLTMGGAAGGTQTLQIDGGATGAALTVLGTTDNLAGGAILNNGAFVSNDSSTFNQGAGTTSGNPITIRNAFFNFTGTGASSFTVIAVGSTSMTGSIAAGQSVDIQGTLNAAGPLTNAGMITGSGGNPNLSVSGGTLTNTGLIRAEASLSGTFNLSGTIANTAASPGGIVDNSLLRNNGTITNTGNFTLASGASFLSVGVVNNNTGGTIANGGTFTVNDNAVFNEGLGGTTTGNPITLRNCFINFSGGGGASSFNVIAVGTSILTGDVGASVSIELSSSILQVNGGPLTLAGTISANGTNATLSISGGATNSGLIRAEAGMAGTFNVAGAITNTGSIVDNSSLTSTGSITSSGPVTVGSGALWIGNGTFSNNTGSSIANGGTFTVNDNQVFNQGIGTATGNPITLRNCFINFTGGGGAAAFNVIAVGSTSMTGNLSATESLELSSSTVNATGGPVTNAGTISANGTNATFNMSGGMTSSGLIRAEAGMTGTFNISGAFTNTGSIVDNSSMTLFGSINDTTGSLTVGSGDVFIANGSISNNGGTIANGGTFTVQDNQTFNQGAGTATGNPITLRNCFINFPAAGDGGAASFNVIAVGSTSMSGSISASESLELSSSTVNAAGGMTNAGTVSANGSNATFNVSGAIANSGLVRAESGMTGTFNIFGQYTNTGNITDNSSMLLGGGTSITNTTGTITVASGATFAANGAISNNGGTIANGGSFTENDNQTFTEGAGTTTGNPIRLRNCFLTITGTGASSFTIIAVGSTAVTGTINAGQTLQLQAGAQENSALTNNGTIDFAGTATIASSVANGGTVHVGDGVQGNINGNYTQSSAGNLAVDIGGAGSFGHLNIGGAATLDGKLSVNTTFAATTGSTFQVVHSNGARTGTFATYAFTGGQSYTATYTANAVVLTAVDPLVVTTTTLPGGITNTAYSGATLASSGGSGTVTWTVPPGTLPPGLSLSSAGAITGTPTAAGTFTFTVTATDSGLPNQTSTKQLSITISDPLVVTTTSLPNAVVNVSYSGGPLASSGGTVPVTWSVASGLPPGLTVNPNGSITGTATTTGTFTFTVTASDSGVGPLHQTATKDLSITVSAQLAVTTTTLPSGVATKPYAGAQLASVNGTAPVTWTVPPGTLPPGLSLSSGGAISGTPTTAGTFSFTVTATDSSSPQQTATRLLSITIAPLLTVTTTTLPSGVSGTAYAGATLASSGGTGGVTWTVPPGTLPPGLSLSSGGAISGTPTTAGTFSFTVTATDSGSPAQTATKQLSITIAAPLVVTTTTLPSGVAGTAYVGATLAKSGGTGAVTWTVPPGTLPPGLSLSSGGAISGTPTAAGTFAFTVTATDSGSPAQVATKNLSITIAAPLSVTTTTLPSGVVGRPPYAGATLASSGGTGSVSTWAVTTGSLPNGLTLNGATGAISGTPTTAGTASFTVTATDSGSPTQQATKNLSITVAAALTVTTTSLPSGTVGTAYPGATLASTGGTGAVTWTVPPGTLPNGLTLSSGGAISGTPTAAGTFAFTVTATDSGSPVQTATKNLSITIAPVNAPFTVTTTSLPSGTVNQAYPATTLQSSGGTGAVTWTVPPGTLPAGLSLSSAGVISGTPTATGTSTFTVTATDSSVPTAQTATKQLSITIGTGGRGITLTSSLNPSKVGQSITFTAVLSPSTLTGTVKFYDAATKLGRDATIENGVATFTTDSLAAGSHQMTAIYKGTPGNPAMTSDVLTQVVNPKTVTTTTLQRLPDPPTSHRLVAIKATVAPGSPTGYVTFYEGATKLGRASVGAGGVATFTTSTLSVGSHQITGQYGGDDDNAASTSAPLTVIVS